MISDVIEYPTMPALDRLPRTEATDVEAQALEYALNKGYWTCLYCTIMNRSEKAHCTSCEKPRPQESGVLLDTYEKRDPGSHKPHTLIYEAVIEEPKVVTEPESESTVPEDPETGD